MSSSCRAGRGRKVPHIGSPAVRVYYGPVRRDAERNYWGATDRCFGEPAYWTGPAFCKATRNKKSPQTEIRGSYSRLSDWLARHHSEGCVALPF